MRIEPSVTSVRVDKWPSAHDKGTRAYRHNALLASREGKAKPARRNAVVVSVRRQPGIAIAQLWTAPVAIHVDDRLVGLALKLGQGFVFFSAGHRTDGWDGKVFKTIDAIREAAGEIPPSAVEAFEVAGV
jgi:hypothetical protein